MQLFRNFSANFHRSITYGHENAFEMSIAQQKLDRSSQRACQIVRCSIRTHLWHMTVGTLNEVRLQADGQASFARQGIIVGQNFYPRY